MAAGSENKEKANRLNTMSILRYKAKREPDDISAVKTRHFQVLEMHGHILS